MVDTKKLEFKIPTKKIEEIKELIMQVSSRNRIQIREVSKTVGKLISFYRSTGPVARVMTTALYQLIAKVAN